MSPNSLENLDPRQLGLQLQQARKQRGLIQQEAAALIGAARTTMVAIEKGERRLKPGELIKLARGYGRQVSDFVRQRPDDVQSFAVQFRASLRRDDTDDEAIKPVIDEWQQLCESYLELEQITDSPLPRRYPEEYDVSQLPVSRAAESIAVAERNRLGLGDGPVPNLRDVLEQEVGLRVFYLAMPSNRFSEIYAFDEKLGGCLAINIKHPVERQRRSLAHGYLHFLTHRHRPVLHYEGQYQRKPLSERLADTFPLYFLMPVNSLLRRFADLRGRGKFTPADLCTLAHYYGVSVQAMALWLEELELLPTGTWEMLQHKGFKVREAQRELQLAPVAERADRLPLRLQHLAIEALDDGLITEGRFASLLGVGRLEAQRLAELLRGHASDSFEGATGLDLSRF